MKERPSSDYTSYMDPDFDPLVAQPSGKVPLPPPGLSADERLRWTYTMLVDLLSMQAMAWPAKDQDGVLRPPPDEHVLDHLVHTNGLLDEERELTSVPAGTVAVVPSLPPCGLCGTPARYDARITRDGQTAGADTCPDCYALYGSGTLGSSEGSAYLMLPGEVSGWVRTRYDAFASARGKPCLPVG